MKRSPTRSRCAPHVTDVTDVTASPYSLEVRHLTPFVTPRAGRYTFPLHFNPAVTPPSRLKVRHLKPAAAALEPKKRGRVARYMHTIHRTLQWMNSRIKVDEQPERYPLEPINPQYYIKLLHVASLTSGIGEGTAGIGEQPSLPSNRTDSSAGGEKAVPTGGSGARANAAATEREGAAPSAAEELSLDKVLADSEATDAFLAFARGEFMLEKLSVTNSRYKSPLHLCSHPGYLLFHLRCTSVHTPVAPLFTTLLPKASSRRRTSSFGSR